ncbi:hypothetical protein ABTX71_35795, partial [Streptomyces parvulus]|uniref:hypothetical protein n=1 Tax=Streptomyces parvulus TaxID=146923 RepID=UPI00331C32CD
MAPVARSDCRTLLCAPQTFGHVEDQPCGRFGKTVHAGQQAPQRPLFEPVDALLTAAALAASGLTALTSAA